MVIIGAGQAGGELAAALRSRSFDGEIVLVGAEESCPYSRPALSKAYLLGELGAGELLLRDAAMYAQQEIEVRPGAAVVAVDRERNEVLLDDGSRLRYTTLVFATGGRPRTLPVPALAAADNLLCLRTLADADRLRGRLRPGTRLAIIGGGYIGLEVASVARRRGLEVTVIEAMPRVLARVTAEPVSRFFQEIHAEEGVDIRLGATIDDYTLDAAGNVGEIRLGDGSRVSVDLVLVGIGLQPNSELAEACGLAVDNGVLVDEFLRTGDPDIYAIGDVSRHPDITSGVTRRLESVPNASEQARAVADTLTGTPRPYTAVPWFWSDQYDVKLQVVGLSDGFDQLVVRSDPAVPRQLAVFYLKDRVIRAADVASSPRDFAVAKKLVAQQAVVEPDMLADHGRPLRGLLALAGARS
ncbi:FAD-dependent oxidoreductase [Streptomyces sp. NPDC046805]|uniref:NAD(P)/FAD-dependent oxidoreductase n=1 Tax=Streptomyces sp. NPDC046805 TaxID=3155134 RepID=UPI0033F34449